MIKLEISILINIKICRNDGYRYSAAMLKGIEQLLEEGHYDRACMPAISDHGHVDIA